MKKKEAAYQNQIPNISIDLIRILKIIRHKLMSYIRIVKSQASGSLMISMRNPEKYSAR